MDAPSPPTPPPVAPRRASHLALGVFLALLLALLAFRGYGNGFAAKPTSSSSVALTDLNRAARAELEQVPGIGPGLAKKIDDHRREKGPFASVDQLRQVKGIGPATLDKVRPFLHVDAAAIQQSPPASLEPLVLERRASQPIPRSGSKTKLQPGDPPVDVNAAGLEQLMTIPGIGPVTAKNILTARSERPFHSIEDLDRVKGIGKKTLEKIRPFVLVK